MKVPFSTFWISNSPREYEHRSCDDEDECEQAIGIGRLDGLYRCGRNQQAVFQIGHQCRALFFKSPSILRVIVDQGIKK
ncbi:hypothetical protein G9X64_16475 [Rhizobium sophorae]|uniref:Uncharacterized protein n=1 Tax=Rhizobium sophorae TaxID=1535242 RepID=A0A7Y3WFF5_9HYPH|nr:hypothetical protein [Rhizobium sophorae]MBX4863426.1 hypothetical protein [Rhizobium bangladeshense]NNU38054.1 hypothetical protein [Rhizobium sophorae]